MGIFRKIKRFFGGIDDVAEDIAGEAIEFASDSIDGLVAVIKESPIGGKVLNTISAVSNRDISGKEKFEAVVEFATPLLKDVIDNGRMDTTIDQIEDLARQLVQSVYNDWANAGGLKRLVQPLISLFRSIF